MARAYLGPGRPRVAARVRVELYVRDVDPSSIGPEDIEARLWTDINDRGFVAESGAYHDAVGENVPMHLVRSPNGRPVLSGNNLVFESDLLRIERTGVFSYTVAFSADEKKVSDPSRAWVPINDIALNRDGVITVSPDLVRRCPSVTEVCVRKVGAKVVNGEFVSGTFGELTRRLETIHTDADRS